MTWRDNLRPGSFRGVPFFVERARTELRIFAHEQTFPDRTAAERAIRVVPLGHGPRRFSVSAYVIGDDYMERRDALEAALQQPGPGRLVHPYRGDRTVSIVNVIRTEESPRAGGRASIEFTCVDVSEAALASRADTQAIVDRDVDAFISELADEFDASYLEEATDSSIAAESVRRFNGASSALRGASQAISQQLGVIDNFANRVRAFEGDLTRIVAAPSAAARAFLGAVGAVAGLPASVIDAAVQSIASVRTVVDDTLDAFAPLARYGRNEPPLPAVSGGGQAQLRLVDAVNTLVRGAAIFESARAIGTLPFASRQQAEEVGLRIADDIDEWILDSPAAGDTVSGARLFERAQVARASVIRRLSTIALTLPEVVSHVVPHPQPLLAIAHHLYGDARRETDILERNFVLNPDLVPDDLELEVAK